MSHPNVAHRVRSVLAHVATSRKATLERFDLQMASLVSFEVALFGERLLATGVRTLVDLTIEVGAEADPRFMAVGRGR